MLFPLLEGILRLWAWLLHRYVHYERRGPLFEFIREGRPCIVALWHQDVFPLMLEFSRHTPSYPSCFMVSHGRIGTIGTRLLNLWDIDCVAGSRRHRGVDAVHELTRRAREEHRSVFLMADGSRGPPRQARWGAIYLARETGLPIIAARAWGDNLVILERTWMRLALPKPWGRAVVLSADPLVVPAAAGEGDALDGYRLELERRLEALVARADAWLTEPERGGSSRHL
jgi:lysophospholipid acyltransferase (LPLAT)-like uncharacterized protein